jgi:hypothetical protein
MDSCYSFLKFCASMKKGREGARFKLLYHLEGDVLMVGLGFK